jgi:hypothetical protein
MARKVVLETGYTFIPASKKIIIPRVIPRERLVLITNVTTNQIIYNFTDSTLKATAYTTSGAANANTTEITLQFNTTSMSDSDKLAIIFDDYNERFMPSEEYTDPVNKLRVSTPQALIDTDFEYGSQTTKWENLALINQRPFAFSSPINITGINFIEFLTNSRTVRVGLAGAAPSVGTPVNITDTFLSPANGNFIVESVSGAGNTIFTYTATQTNTTNITNIFDTNKTGISSALLFTSARIGSTPTAVQYSGTGIVTFFTTVPHGLAIGNNVAIRGTTATTNPPNGSFSIVGVSSARAFQVAISTNPIPTGTVSGGEIYVIPQGNVLHRPYDGGVIFSSNANGNFETMVRQTRRYFRYQSGKGIQVSSGTILRPNLQIDSISATGVSAGSTVNVITKEQHNIQPGTNISITGSAQTAYNGNYTITSVTGYNSFQYSLPIGAATTVATGGTPYVTVTNWYGATNRLGIFDEQNGMYFEYDGQQLYAVRRSSTFQLSGKVSVVQNTNTITQTNSSFPTFFSKQLQIGSYVVIRGQSYRVIDIANDTSLTISPSYRGANADYVNISETINLRVPQSEWNIDKLNGTGPSGMTLDLGKMQMWYIDYSWYGAGFIRYGLRGPDGNVLYCHKIANNNINTEAYMRSGNLPARYESQAVPPTTQINRSVGTSETFIGVTTTAGFPPTGTLVIRDAETYEYINYAGIGTTAFTQVSRAKAGGAVTLTVTQGSNSCTAVGSTANLQIGMRAVHPSFPDGTWISAITSPTAITLSQAATGPITAGVVTFPAMGANTGQAFTYDSNNPGAAAAVELAYPTFGPTISHWGTSVMMDGRFDDDKSLIFTFGQSNEVTLSGKGARSLLLAIRVAPSVDNGQTGIFGTRELVNRMQLTLRALDISSDKRLLVQAILNPVGISTAANWTNAVGGAANVVNSSLAQIHSATGPVTVTGGEVISGFFVGTGVNSLDLTQLRDLGNSILGGGGAPVNSAPYPDGPDVLAIIANTLEGGDAKIFARLSWTEAQA